MHRIGKDWLHWGIGSWCHFGFHRHGDCWRLWKFEVSKYGTCTFYKWWRFFIAIQKAEPCEQ